MTGDVTGDAGPARRLAAVLVAVPFVVPLGWLVLSVLLPRDAFGAVPPVLVPAPPSLDAIARVATLLDVPRLTLNSLCIATVSAVAMVVSSSLAGFAFATLPARGRGAWFAILLATIMIPPALLVVPQFVLFSTLGWVGTWLPLLVPSLAGSAFFIVLFRQWFRGLPAHLVEQAELDGADPWQTYRHVAMPLARPATAAVAVLAFVGAWNDLLGPLVYLRAPDTFTISLGIASFRGTDVTDVQAILAASLLALIPPLVLFLVAHRALVGGVASGGWRA